MPAGDFHSAAGATEGWQPLSDADLGNLAIIAGRVHPCLPERLEVFAEKRQLFPLGCYKFAVGSRMVGYAIVHPWRRDDVPALDCLLGALPACPDCLFLHDVAILPEARGRGASASIIRIVTELAQARVLPVLTLVAAYGTARHWRRFGFLIIDEPGLAAKLLAYGADARLMACRLSHATGGRMHNA